MIKELKIKNFKCFHEPSPFEFSKLNLLTGINGRGKSSLLQTILVLSQSVRNNTLNKLIFNGDLVDLGNFDDVKNSDTPRRENIAFDFKLAKFSFQSMNMQFSENPDDILLADCTQLSSDRNEKENTEDINSFFELLKSIHFVSADRLGPVKYVEKTNLPDFVSVGSRGEHTINILANSMNLPVVNDEMYKGEDSKSLIQQTTEWLGYVLEGAKIEIKGKDKDSSVLYMLLNNQNDSFGYKPTNVGFGYSYILPLIVTGLIAKPGEIVIIENPEAHLHPRAQSRIAEFFTRVAATGVQVFIESHSEHVLNGLRVSSLNPEIKITHKDLLIHYFDESFNSEKLTIDEKGKIKNWPTGFFDQQEIDLANIFKLSQ